eukprot:320645_1
MSLASILNWNLFVPICILIVLVFFLVLLFVFRYLAALGGYYSFENRLIELNRLIFFVSGLTIYVFMIAPCIDIYLAIQTTTSKSSASALFQSWRQEVTFAIIILGQIIHLALCFFFWAIICIKIELMERRVIFQMLIRSNEAFYFDAYKYINGLPPQSVYDKNRSRPGNNNCSICGILFNRTTLETILECGDKFHRSCLRLYESRTNKIFPSLRPRCPACAKHYKWLQKWTYQYPERDDVRQTGLMGTVPTDVFNVVDQFCVSQN